MLSAILFVGCDTPGGNGSNDNDSYSGSDNGANPSIDTIQGTDNLGGIDPGTGVNQMALYGSGTRIKAKVATTADGAKAFQTWYDTQLDTDCWFAATADGTFRCVPNFATTTYYSDPECSKLMFVLIGSTQCLGWTYKWGQTCASDSQCYSKCLIFELGDVVNPAKMYAKSADGSCSGSDTAPFISAGWSFRSAGKEVAPSIFAAVSVAIQD